MLDKAQVFDLDAYLARIGYSGSRSAKLETFEAVHLAHVQTIPFENLNPLLRWPVRLDIRSLQQKMVQEGRGGYCFEHNLLFGCALTALGFEVTGLSARVLWNQPEDVVPARSHMLLLVDLDDRAYIADVGFGGQTLTGPLRLQQGIVQATPHEPFRLLAVSGSFLMQACIRGEWKVLYRFDLQEQFLPDYEVMSWYLSNHPTSHFVTGLTAARPERDRRYALRNTDLTVHHVNGETERRRLATAAELRAALENVFRLTLPDAPELHATLDRLVVRAA
jgi:N-hydroxyarylamine O-acetyltransferase